ncbi:MAG: cation:dicarboxylase symporter family transporter [Bacteroidales bacterium]|nr:cation:dicarboxylase symporter family transporter [Bacteroidales bacterium]
MLGLLENPGRLGLKTMGYYLLSTFVAIVTGFFLVQLIKPGIGADLGLQVPLDEIAVGRESFGQTLINIVPSNVIKAMAEGHMLSIIFFAILVGFFTTVSGEKSRGLMVILLSAILDVIMKITVFIIRFHSSWSFQYTCKGDIPADNHRESGERRSLAAWGFTF